jgi:hypothetical protein
MIDMIGAFVVATAGAGLAGILIGLTPLRAATKLALFVVAAAWGGLIVAIAARGGFVPGVLSPVPAPPLAFAGFLALLVGAWFRLPRFRSALLAVPLPALVGINATRLLGLFFLILYADGRLPAPFAPVASVGDMAVAALAIPLATLVARGTLPSGLGLWNALGALDLVVAVALGVLSAPGTPFRVFDGPGTSPMATLPWVLIPTMIVPLYLLIHLVIAAKLRALRPTPAAAIAG